MGHAAINLKIKKKKKVDRDAVSEAEIATCYAANENLMRKFFGWALQPQARYGDNNFSI